ncbi:MAG: class I SAM-dependent methyltransferase [Allorhizobium sp.]
MIDMEQINRATWRNPLALREYQRLAGYLNPGEQAAFERALTLARGGRVLDIGVGAGRTTDLLEDFSQTYLGVDYTPEMIALASANHPDTHFELMDARDLAGLADGSFDLVVFSYNGIDSVDGPGRLAVLTAVSRVLAPGGIFLFSTFNRDWQGFSDGLSYSGRVLWTANPLRLGLRMLRYGYGFGTSSLRKLRYSGLEQRDGEHASLLHSAHDFGVMIYATTPAQIDRQLQATGFETPAILIGGDGEELNPGNSTVGEEYFQVIARKPVGS